MSIFGADQYAVRDRENTSQLVAIAPGGFPPSVRCALMELEGTGDLTMEQMAATARSVIPAGSAAVSALAGGTVTVADRPIHTSAQATAPVAQSAGPSTGGFVSPFLTSAGFGSPSSVVKV